MPKFAFKLEGVLRQRKHVEQEKMRALLKRYFRKEMGRRPMILPVIWEM